MYNSTPFPGQADQVFKDKFCKWPTLMRTLVFISLLPSTALIFLFHNDLASLTALESAMMVTAVFNLLMLCWGAFLKIRSRKYWYRNYHIGKTMLLATLPLLACGYVFLLTPEVPDMVKQQKAQIVQISVN